MCDTKTCSSCRRELPLSDFYRKEHSYCKECSKEYAREIKHTPHYKQWYAAFKAKGGRKEADRRKAEKAKETLPDWYCIKRLKAKGHSKEDITQEMIQDYRDHIKAFRARKNK